MPTSSTIRARTVPELIDAAFRILREHYGTFILLATIARVPTWLTLWLTGWYQTIADPTKLITGAFTLFSGWFGLVYLLCLAWWSLADSAIIAAASDAYLGREVVPGNALRQAWGVGGGVIGARILKGIVLGVSTVFFFIPMLYFAARYFAVLPALLLERTSITDSFHRSRDLSQDAKWRILGGLALAFLIYLIVTIALSSIAGLFSVSPQTSGILGGVAYILAYPLVGIVMTLLYYDMRIRKEGFDLELLAQHLDPVPAAGA